MTGSPERNGIRFGKPPVATITMQNDLFAMMWGRLG
jgi:hypothetical protein